MEDLLRRNEDQEIIRRVYILSKERNVSVTLRNQGDIVSFTRLRERGFV